MREVKGTNRARVVAFVVCVWQFGARRKKKCEESIPLRQSPPFSSRLAKDTTTTSLDWQQPNGWFVACLACAPLTPKIQEVSSP